MHELGWGRHYVAVEPTHFRVDYVINPFMDPHVQPDPALAMRQWRTMVDTLRALGATVDVVPQRPDAPDMVYAMNLGLGLVREDGDPHVVMSHMRYPQRRMEGLTARPWFEEHGFAPTALGGDGVGPHFEAGDAFAFGDALVVGYGPRTEEAALERLATDLGVRVRGLRITHPGMYHLDLAFCPLDATRALVCPDAFDDASAAAVLDLVPDPIVLTEQEALTTFAANSIVLPSSTGVSTVVMPGCPDRVRAELEAAGFEVVVLDLSEFHKGGGSIRCLTNPVDVRLGRDLVHVPGGEVHLP
jgi:N-dimethylarginine dimethylaminohydrolase